MKITLGFSPCPNDTFIFDALVNSKIDTQGFEFDHIMADVQQLNEWALEGKLDLTKISIGVFPLISKNYLLLDSGGALGKGVGPLLITAKNKVYPGPDLNNLVVALPGKNTTAHYLFSRAYPACTRKKFMIFSAIEDAVLSGDCDYGVIIHENRFTYAEKGLQLVQDLGNFWETSTGLPVPLGAIAGLRTLPEQVLNQVDELIQKSVSYAFKHYHTRLPEFVTCNAQAMNEPVMRSHIELYVNEYSVSMGEKGKQAIQMLCRESMGKDTTADLLNRRSFLH